MVTQRARRQNLLAVIEELRKQGYEDWSAITAALGNPVTPERLRGMASGRSINAWMAAHVEHVLGKPRGWMDHDGASVDPPAEASDSDR